MRKLIKLTLFLTLMLNSLNSLSYEIQADLTNTSGVKEVLVGDVFEAQIRIWPFKGEQVELIYGYLKGKVIADYFRVTKVKSASYGKDNDEVLVLNVSLVLLSYYDSEQLNVWVYKDLNIPLEFKNIKPVKTEEAKGFIIAKQEELKLNQEESLLPFILVSIIILLILIFFGMKLKNRGSSKKVRLNSIKKWNTQFQRTSKRSEFERIYKNRKEWLELLSSENSNVKEFFIELNKHQFKKQWNEGELDEVKNTFDLIRNIFRDLK